MWKMPSSNERTLLHATPVPSTTVTASPGQSANHTHHTGHVCAGITVGYLCNTRFPV